MALTSGSGGAVVVVGGTRGIGRALAAEYVRRGAEVIVTGRDGERTQAVARDLGAAGAVAIDLADPHAIAPAFASLGPVARVAFAAIERDSNTVRDYDVDSAVRLATLKVVGYTEVIHQLVDRLVPGASILLFGGLAKDRPYPGSTTVTTVNGAVAAMVRTFALQLAPVRVNAIHPGIVEDTEVWQDQRGALDAIRERTPTGQLVRTAEVVDAATFLLENPALNGVNLAVDGGWLLR